MPSDRLAQIRISGDVPRHVAIIMDGNGRWAKARGRPREFGHRAGMVAVREVVEGCIEAGIPVLTLYAFSQENWKRPRGEVRALMSLLELYVRKEARELRARGVEVRALGRLERLSPRTRAALAGIIESTAGGPNLQLNLAISYGGRAEIADAARALAERVARGTLVPEEIDEALVGDHLYTAGTPDPDLLIRTSGEQRISNFMLWQLAYTELHISPILWPDFKREDLFAAVLDYQRRERRFGGVVAG
ncbi:MAG TPA: isoprenyl transferase [Longimicrobiaceae bacterium]